MLKLIKKAKPFFKFSIWNISHRYDLLTKILGKSVPYCYRGKEICDINSCNSSIRESSIYFINKGGVYEIRNSNVKFRIFDQKVGSGDKSITWKQGLYYFTQRPDEYLPKWVTWILIMYLRFSIFFKKYFKRSYQIDNTKF